MSCICFYTRNCSSYIDLYNNLHHLNKARKHLEQYLEICSIRQQTNLMQQQQKIKTEQQQLNKQMSAIEINDYLNAINLQIEVTKFIYNCNKEYNNNENKEKTLNQKTPTLFGTNDTKINLCCLILLSGQSIQEGFGFVIRIIQVKLNSNDFCILENFFMMQILFLVFQLKFDIGLFSNSKRTGEKLQLQGNKQLVEMHQ